MPNHCHNRVTFYAANTDAVAKIKQIFEMRTLWSDHTRTRLGTHHSCPVICPRSIGI